MVGRGRQIVAGELGEGRGLAAAERQMEAEVQPRGQVFHAGTEARIPVVKTSKRTPEGASKARSLMPGTVPGRSQAAPDCTSVVGSRPEMLQRIHRSELSVLVPALAEH